MDYRYTGLEGSGRSNWLLVDVLQSDQQLKPKPVDFLYD